MTRNKLLVSFSVLLLVVSITYGYYHSSTRHSSIWLKIEALPPLPNEFGFIEVDEADVKSSPQLVEAIRLAEKWKGASHTPEIVECTYGQAAHIIEMLEGEAPPYGDYDHVFGRMFKYEGKFYDLHLFFKSEPPAFA